MTTLFIVLVCIFLVLFFLCFVFFKLWRHSKKNADNAEKEIEKLNHRIDLDKNQKEIFDEVFDKNKKEKEDLAAAKGEEAMKKVMDEFRSCEL